LAKAIGGAGGVVVVTGDLHSSWAWEGPANDGGQPSMVELVAPAVSSDALAVGLPTAAGPVEAALSRLADGLSHVDFSSHGYVLVELAADSMQAEWWYVDRDGGEPARFGAGRTAPRAVPMHLQAVEDPLPDPDRPGTPAEGPGPSTGGHIDRTGDDSPTGALVGGAALAAAAAAAIVAVRRRRS